MTLKYFLSRSSHLQIQTCWCIFHTCSCAAHTHLRVTPWRLPNHFLFHWSVSMFPPHGKRSHKPKYKDRNQTLTQAYTPRMCWQAPRWSNASKYVWQFVFIPLIPRWLDHSMYRAHLRSLAQALDAFLDRSLECSVGHADVRSNAYLWRQKQVPSRVGGRGVAF